MNVDWATFAASVLTSVIGTIAALYLFFVVRRGHRPNMTVELVPSWLDRNAGLLTVRIVVISQYEKFAKIASAQLQYLEHQCPINSTISEFVPFTHEYYKSLYLDDKGKPKDGAPGWREPDKVLTRTGKLEPQERICVERLVKCNPESIIQLGLQVKSAKTKDSWTTTCFAPHKNAIHNRG